MRANAGTCAQTTTAAADADLRSVVFVAPRYHTNQVAFVRWLQQRGIRTSFFVVGRGQSEDHSDVSPTTLRFLWRPKPVQDPQRGVTDALGPAYRRGVLRLRTMRALYNLGADVAIIRMPASSVGFLAAIALRFSGSKLVFYTQAAAHRKRRVVRDRLLNLYAGLFGASWLTPIPGDRANPQPLCRTHIVPFAAKSSHLPVRHAVQRLRLLMVAKFVPRKRHDLLLDALARLADDLPLSVTFVGEVSDTTGTEVFEDTQARARQIPFPTSFRTNVPPLELAAIYAGHDAFVLPAQNEPASMSQIEAMAAGLSVLLSDCNPMVSWGGGRILTFECGSVTSLANRIETLASSPDLVRSNGKALHDIVGDTLAPGVVYPAFLAALGYSSKDWT